MGLDSFDTNGDQKVTADELAANGLIQALLAPDVAIFDAGGGFDPNPSAPEKDCLSLGVEFSGVRASF
jgi:hypothetical protein